MGGWTRRIVSRCVQYGPTLILIIFTDKESVFSQRLKGSCQKLVNLTRIT